MSAKLETLVGKLPALTTDDADLKPAPVKKPADAKGKNYTVKTTLVSNDKTYKENTYKVSLLGNQTLVLAALY